MSDQQSIQNLLNNQTFANQLRLGCLPYNATLGIDATDYGYLPSLGAGIAFVILFALSMGVHIVQTFMTRTWWTFVFSVGALAELLGWAGRIWVAECVYNKAAFIMQICTLILAPTFFTAGIYVILGRLILLSGRASSLISPKVYLYIFCSCDIISLILQAVGGALASTAAPADSGTGTHIMVGGIAFQLASILIFCLLLVDFLRRSAAMRVNFTKQQKTLLCATAFSITLIVIRSIYRLVELAQGWDGYLITHEGYFIGLDGVLMILAVAVFNVVNPGYMLKQEITRGSASAGYEGEEVSPVREEKEKSMQKQVGWLSFTHRSRGGEVSG